VVIFFLSTTKKYEEVWKELKESEASSCEADLKIIREKCSEAKAVLKKGCENAVLSVGLGVKVLYWIGATGVGRFSRTGKIRQATTNIDDLFAEVSSMIMKPLRTDPFLLLIFLPFSRPNS
jgi:hypothetical protein